MEPIKTCVLIYNPVATRFNNAVMEQVVRRLERQKIETSVVMSNWKGDITSLVAKHNPLCDMILTMGGDGTVGEAFQGFHGQEQRALYSHLPVGTGNDMAVNFNLVPKNAIASLERILDGKEHILDVLTVNGDPLSFISSFGYITSTPYLIPQSVKRHFGYAGYVSYGLMNLAKGQTPIDIRYTKNGEWKEESVVMGFMTNAMNFAGVDFYPDVDLNDGLFEVMFIKSFNFKFFQKLLPVFLKNNVDMNNFGEYVEMFRADEMTLCFDNKKANLDFCNDGDRYAVDRDENLTMRYKIDGKLRMLLPDPEKAARYKK